MLTTPQVVIHPASRASSRLRQYDDESDYDDEDDDDEQDSSYLHPSTTAAEIDNDNTAVQANDDGGGDGDGADDSAPRSEQIANHHANNSAGASSATAASRRGSVSVHRKSLEDDDEDDANLRPAETGGGGGGGGYWGAASRPSSPGVIMGDTGGGSEVSSIMPPPSRPKSRMDQGATSKYNNLSYWRARKVLFYKNGDPFFPGVEFRFKPGRDIVSLESLLDKLSLRMDLPRGARYVFSMDGDRKLRLEELEDGASYVVSSYKTFKQASYGKKNGVWYGPAMPSQGWKPPLSRKSSIVEAADAPPPGGGSKPSSGRVIRIINNQDHTVQCRVLLNLRTSQPFEEVLEDLGQVLKMNGAKRMYTVAGQEVRSFSQLRNEFADVDTFYLATSVGALSSPVRRSRSRAATHNPTQLVEDAREVGTRSRRARSKSRARVLYAGEPDIIRAGNDYSLMDVMKEEPIRVTIRGLRRTFYPPLHHPPHDNTPPEKRLQISWVYGYRGTDSKRNLWVLPTGEMLYFVGAVAVLYDRDEDAQRHYIGHTEDIQCMDLHPSREMVASGQRAGRNRKTQAHIRIWSTETLLTLYVFGMGEFEVGVSAVAFSQLNGGSYVLAVDAGRERILSVWQWQWGHLLGKVATLQDDLTGAAFHPLDDNLLITHGKGHLTFWTRRKDGFFERTDIIKPPSRTNVTTLQFEQDGDVVTADGDGFITIYSVDSDGAYFVRMEFEAHTKGISALVMLSEGTLLSGGEKDRKIIAWDTLQNYKKITETKLPESAGGVRSIYPQRPGRNDGNIYVGTTRNNIMEGSLQRRFNQVVFGHSRHLWGLAVHPDDDLFATGGHDKNIAMWRRNKLLWSVQVRNEYQTGLYENVSLCFHPFGVVLAAGSTEGHLVVLNAENGAPVVTIRVCGSPLNCLGYNPAGDMIAIGSQNGSVYLFRVSRDGFSYKKWNKIRGSQPLTQLDWSTDGCYLQTVTADYDLVFWDIKNVVTEKSPIGMKDVKWYTHNATVGFLVAGIWNNRFYPMASLIVSANRSAAHDLLVIGDADGYLRLFRYPCLSAKAEYNEEKVYSMQIATARFMYNDKNVVTVGGTDATLILWDVIDD
ncbi:echinoderm microtubule-associated protein-like CG42247 isoform X1 [Periplaneta americana]|uniref:echinoderm microtubule-associated protein-like CG42247 isoform X1 n=1 Tax=Periplaneta americana TaxID=6978 RepID=UPI0037E85FF7